MFSPAKAITAGAIVFAIGGVFLIAQPFDQQGSVPGAETDTGPVAAVWVTGDITTAGCSGPTASTPEPGVRPEREHHQCGPQRWQTSDPRLTGLTTATWVNDIYESEEGIISVQAGTYAVENESGGWLCSNPAELATGMGRYAELVTTESLTCIGGGEYDGLTALLILDWSVFDPGAGVPVPLTGLIFPGDPPPLPEPPAAE